MHKYQYYYVIVLCSLSCSLGGKNNLIKKLLRKRKIISIPEKRIKLVLSAIIASTYPLLKASASWSMASNRLVSAPSFLLSSWLKATRIEENYISYCHTFPRSLFQNYCSFYIYNSSIYCHPRISPKFGLVPKVVIYQGPNVNKNG